MREWPIVFWWYTRKKGMTIEESIDADVEWVCWAIKNFQNVTPAQARYLEQKTGRKLKPQYIQDVEPYEYKPGDPEQLYMELCETQDLVRTLRKYRGEQLSMF